MTAARDWDVVIAGAGPAGSVAALVLARSGVRVALADKAAFPRDKACGDLVGPRGVRVLNDLGISVPDAGRGADLAVAGPSGRRARLPAFEGRAYPGYGLIVPRTVLDDALRSAAIEAGATAVRARISAVEAGPGGCVRALVASDGRRLAGRYFVGADGALSPVARLTGMLDDGSALWGFAIRGYLPARVPLPLLVLLDAAPWRIYPGYGWLFPGADGQANVGIGVGMGGRRQQARLGGDLARLCEALRAAGDLDASARPGPVTGGWLRMGGTGTPPAAGNVLLAGDAAGLVNPLQGEGIAAAMISGRMAGEAIAAGLGAAGPGAAGPGAAGAGGHGGAGGPGGAATAYTAAVTEFFGPYYRGAVALERLLLRRPRLASALIRGLTTAPLRAPLAGAWSLYWNGLADGAAPRPAAAAARLAQALARRLPEPGVPGGPGVPGVPGWPGRPGSPPAAGHVPRGHG